LSKRTFDDQMRFPLSLVCLSQRLIFCSSNRPINCSGLSLARGPSRSPLVATLLNGYPGSGNTWLRLVIESLIGTSSGSIFPFDSTENVVFPYNKECNRFLALIKAHPSWTILCNEAGVPSLQGNNLCLRPNTNEYALCRRGGVISFRRIVFPVRDPILAIFSEFKRQISNSHVGQILHVNLSNAERWLRVAVSQSKSLNSTWNEVIYPFLTRFQSHLDSGGVTPATILEPRFLILRYENLLNQTQREHELLRILGFMNIPHQITKLEVRKRCSFPLSDDWRIHRANLRVQMPVIAELTELATIHFNPRFPCFLWDKLRWFTRNFSYPKHAIFAGCPD
jgi:hypothetical protein